MKLSLRLTLHCIDPSCGSGQGVSVRSPGPAPDRRAQSGGEDGRTGGLKPNGPRSLVRRPPARTAARHARTRPMTP
jgi:hypothetical protein